ncbi:MAG: hypothetical protein K5770_11575 [Lachnospiraceae bacterium]|nr:hypothetical protein [Lachnospiraceae bacterium]
MKRKSVIFLLAAAMVLSLTACSSSKTTTTTVSTSFTDENGETTTHTTTTTTENGQTTTEEDTATTVSEEEPDETEEIVTEETVYEPDPEDIPTLRDEWAEYFEYGAEGQTDEDETVLFTYDDPENLTQAALMIISPDNELTLYDIGPVRAEEDYYVIEDIDGDVELPFAITDTADDYFEMGFQDGSYAQLYYVDKDTIIDDMVYVIEQVYGEGE